MHAPLVQPSATVVLHAVHAPPIGPQFCTEGGSHVLPLQQPVEHVCEQPSHALFTHMVPFEHATQALPPEPHAPG